MKVLMVCLGNICRSPLAEGILQQKVQQASLGWQVDSAGTGDWHIGQAPHRLSQKVAKMNGIDISYQKGRQFRPQDMIHFDKIYFMDIHNYRDAQQMAGHLWDSQKADLLLNEIFPGQNRPVPDPYTGGEEDFHAVFELISEACETIIAKNK